MAAFILKTEQNMNGHEADCKLESQISLPHITFQKNKCLYEVYKKDNDFNASLFLVGKKS